MQNDYLTSSASSIDIARAAGADEFAPVELNNARAKLERARMLSQTGKRAEAQELAEEADVDAQVANSKAMAERSARALIEVENGLRALREQGARQPAPAPQQPGSQVPPPPVPQPMP